MKHILLLCLLSISLIEVPAQTASQSYEGFTNEEVSDFHNRFENEYNVWAAGGDLTRYTFLNMSMFWAHEVIYKKGPIKILPYELDPKIDKFKVTAGQEEISFHKYVNNSLVNGLIIIHQGKIVFEQYPRMYPYELHNWMSITKSFVPAILSLLEDRNEINRSLTVEHYLPELKGSSWDGIKITDLLNMSSGIDCRESEADRMNPNSCIRNYFADLFNSKNSDSQLQMLKAMPKIEAPGQTFNYSSVNTDVLTKIIEKVTGKKFNKLIQEEIWNYVGSESNALMLTTINNGSHTFMGMSSTLRDLARYGLLFTPSGKNRDAPLNTDNYIKRIQSDFNPKLRNKSWFYDEEKFNNYHWDDVYDDGDFVKYGMAGQGLYISPSRDLVIAYFGTWNSKKEYGKHIEFSRLLVKSGIFDQ